MKYIIVNITSWTRVGSAGAEHYYGKVYEVESDLSIYQLAEDGAPLNVKGEELYKPLTKEDAVHLNKKDKMERYARYKEGELTSRFNSIEEIKKRTNELYPECDLIFLNDWKLISEDRDIIVRNPERPKKTGLKIQINGFEGYSREFVNLTEGSIHEVIETPERYKHKELQEGVWVWGVTEPVLVLKREYIRIY